MLWAGLGGGEGEKWKKLVVEILCRTGPGVKEIARRKIMKIMCGKTGKTFCRRFYRQME